LIYLLNSGGEIKRKMNIEEKFEPEFAYEDAGCPYFFDSKCSEKIYEDRFQQYCLRNFTECETYKQIERRKKLKWI
jgi:hypothetical protein